MNKPLPLKSNRRAGFAARLARFAALLALAAAIGQLTFAVDAHAAAAPAPSHKEILNSIDAVQTTVDSIETKTDAVKSKLDLIPPAWSQVLPVAERFVLVMGGASVLDKETGLVWEKSPSVGNFLWDAALFHCLTDTTTGGRKGWRLPKIEEYATLVDPTQEDPALPVGHPFTNIQVLDGGTYWSATSNPGIPGEATYMVFNSGNVGSRFKQLAGNEFHAWCVRGAAGVIDGIP